MWRLAILTSVFFAGCTIPAHIFFRNYSNNTVRLQATLVDRRYFKKLPNEVNFYDTSTFIKQYYGKWQGTHLVTWKDSINFYLDVPAYSVIDVADISNGLTLGARQPDVLLLLIAGNKVDTLTTGDYISVAKKFQSTGYSMFRDAVYYYDFH